MNRYPRDLHGHGPNPPDPAWPASARIAVQVVLNYEEGGERCLLHGDTESEAFLSESVGAAPWPGMRNPNMESMYEYGARAGFWRLHRCLTGFGVPVTVFGVAEALARGPAQVAAMQKAGWEIASHGLRWIEYAGMPEAEERRQMAEAIGIHTAVTGEPPLGWYTGRCSINTLRLAAEHGFHWVSDSYADDLPYWVEVAGRHQLVVPYTLDANDMRFATPQGFNSGEQFFTYLRDSFDELYAEGAAGAPKMMSIGLHCRLAGRPGRTAGLRRFLEHASTHGGVWFARRIDIARHWAERHPPQPRPRPSAMDRATFLALTVPLCGAAIAEAAFEAEMGAAQDTAEGLAAHLAATARSIGAEPAATPAQIEAALDAHGG